MILIAKMPTTPYPHPKSNTLSFGAKSIIESIDKVPVSIDLGVNIVASDLTMTVVFGKKILLWLRVYYGKRQSLNLDMLNLYKPSR